MQGQATHSTAHFQLKADLQCMQSDWAHELRCNCKASHIGLIVVACYGRWELSPSHIAKSQMYLGHLLLGPWHSAYQLAECECGHSIHLLLTCCCRRLLWVSKVSGATRGQAGVWLPPAPASLPVSGTCPRDTSNTRVMQQLTV